MTDTLPAAGGPASLEGLEGLKEAARRRRRRDEQAEAEAAEAERRFLRAEWLRLLGQVERDQPLFRGLIDEVASAFTGRSAHYPDLDPGTPDVTSEATLYVALPGHERVALKYARTPSGAYGRSDFGKPGEAYRVAAGWSVAPGHPDGVESGEWLYFADLGEALLAAEDSYKERCARTQEAVKRRQEREESRRKLESAPPARVEELLALALKDCFLQWASDREADLAEESLANW